MKKASAAKRKKKRQQLEKRQPSDQGHGQRFDQLLDDAIFGVKKKNPRG